MSKKKRISNNVWGFILGIIFIAAFIYGGNAGWFKSSDEFNNYPPVPSEKLPDLDNKPSNPSCTLSVNPTSIISGNSFTVSLIDGIVKSCEIYINNGSEWRSFEAGKTDIEGKLSRTFTILSTGNYKARAICGDCLTNYGYLNINPVPEKTCSEKAEEANSYYKEPSSSSANCMYIANTECQKAGKISTWTSNQGTCCLFKCIDQPPIPAQKTCTDTDNGLDYNVQGRCTVKNELSEQIWDGSDNCASSSYVNEMSCGDYQTTGDCTINSYKCPSGSCLNGACSTTGPLDSDGDGYSNEEEISAGTNPNDSQSYPNGPLEQCANHCMDIGYHGATTHVSSSNACWTDTVSTCRMEFGLDAEASTYADGCCCQECVGW